MYVTRPLSLYRRSPQAAHMPPPQGPNSGYLAISDEESEAEATHCWGTCKDGRIRDLPFPQNKILAVRYIQPTGTTVLVYLDNVFLIPVMNQPLSSNRYYVITADGKYKGQAWTCSREEDMRTCCFCKSVKDLKPSPLDPTNIYQQVEMTRHRSGCFIAKSVAPDAYPPEFLRRKGWRLDTSSSTPSKFQLAEACGLDAAGRLRLPEFNFPISSMHSPPIVVGKWYCPFVFIKEEIGLKDQMQKSMFYEMSLVQMWEAIHTSENKGILENAVAVSANVQNKVVRVSNEEAMQEVTNVVDGMRWFKTTKHGGGLRVGLSLAIIERMMWEEVRGGWTEGKEGEVRVERVEKFGRVEGGWKRFGCYVLVERFVLKRMDGSVVIKFDFRHTNKIQCKWE